MPTSIINGPTIAAGESLSDAVDLSGSDQLIRVYMPSDWKSAVLTLLVSNDGVVPYRSVYNVDGREIQMVVTAGAAILIPDTVGKGLGFIKLRSGTAEWPVAQPLERAFQLVVQTGGP